LIPISDISLYTRHVKHPIVNVSLIVLNALVFIYGLTLGDLDTFVFNYRYGLVPNELTSGLALGLVPTQAGVLNLATPFPTWGTLATSMFIHGGIMHFGGNMVYLWVFGDNLENRTGHIQYLAFYLVTGLAASGLQIMTAPSSQTPIIGASGAIAGVLGGYLVLFPRNRVQVITIMYFITMIRVPAIALLAFWLLLQFWGGFGTLGATGGGVAYWAHVGGFIAGMGIAGLYRLIAGHAPINIDYNPDR
jgi:membrane associated rhomboid family serine protease